jgi:hypothetical protein
LRFLKEQIAKINKILLKQVQLFFSSFAFNQTNKEKSFVYICKINMRKKIKARGYIIDRAKWWEKLNLKEKKKKILFVLLVWQKLKFYCIIKHNYKKKLSNLIENFFIF